MTTTQIALIITHALYLAAAVLVLLELHRLRQRIRQLAGRLWERRDP